MQTLINAMLSGNGQPTPEIGSGATICRWSDRDPATVISVTLFKTGARKGQMKTVTVRRDKARVVAGSTHDGSAQYLIERDENGIEDTYTVNKEGRLMGSGGDSLRIGDRSRYYDPHL